MLDAAARVLRLAFVPKTTTKPMPGHDPLIDIVAYLTILRPPARRALGGGR